MKVKEKEEKTVSQIYDEEMLETSIAVDRIMKLRSNNWRRRKNDEDN